MDPAHFLGLYLPLDIVALVLAFAGSWALASFMNGLVFHRPLYDAQHDVVARVIQFSLVACIALLNFERTGHYKLRMPFWIEVQGICGTLAFAMAFDGFLLFASKQDFSRLSLVLAWVPAAPLIIGAHAALRNFLRRRNLWEVPTLLIGGHSAADDAWDAVRSEASLGYNIVAQVKDLPRAFDEASGSWENLCARNHADYVLIALDGPELARTELPLAQLMREKVPFSLSPPLKYFPVSGMVPHYFFNHDVMLLTNDKGLEQPLPRLIKRCFDIGASSVALVALAPLMLVLAFFIRRDGGPALYGHKRIGLNGASFTCLKFRSMIHNSGEVLRQYLASNPEAAAEWKREWKLHDDPRVTRLGRFLRKSSLDELPQLFNVLHGDMSLVGPRPIVLAEAGRYNHDIAYYRRVRPGITGLWQVSGRNDVSYERRVWMDSWYVRNWSLWNDIAILCKTITVLATRQGAY